MSPWLVVTGNGSWTGVDRHRYEAGVHEVSDKVAEEVRAARIRSLVVMDERPLLRAPEVGTPLTRDDLTRAQGVQIAVPGAETTVPEESSYLGEVPRDCACGWCPWRGPSAASLRHHERYRHAIVDVLCEVAEAAASVPAAETPERFPTDN